MRHKFNPADYSEAQYKKTAVQLKSIWIKK